ncbi:hypothetical protein CCAX7_34030 [Capsulimonas corticalis]|uniref:Uncharacterized protein n=1 Tax=Capsulimonas corticalis TaxID=2219043 RepID=A0A402CYG2_9BACT|nr:ABC transporter permease [Capsulimonas corticalis]BDI31352.1 hypothetical protein CCAX7_34030 [Capsulimonas corticalis]
MKRLIWKEWRETRMTPAAFCLIFFAMNLFLIEVQYLADHATGNRLTPPGGIYTLHSIELMGAACSLLAAVVCGGGIVSREASRGTLSFLTGLPISRRSLWLVKVGVGFAGAVTALLGIAIIGQAFVWANFGWAAAALDIHGSAIGLLLTAILMLGVFTAVYAVSYAASCLSDRTFNSVVLSIGSCLAIFGAVLGLGSLLNAALGQKVSDYQNHLITLREFDFYLPLLATLENPGPLVIAIGVGLLSLAAIALQIAYSSFGSTERSRRRYLIPLRVISKWTAVYASVGAAAYSLYMVILFHIHPALMRP